jgi:NTP pyrophosphatase (non-canonical NTP hydrolase)
MGEQKRNNLAIATRLHDLSNQVVFLLNMKSEEGRAYALRRVYEALPEHRKAEVETPP